MSGDDQGDDDWIELDLDLDFIAAGLKLADGGDQEAVRGLLEMAAAQLSMGQITDNRLRLWLIDYLTRAAEQIPGDPGRPSEGETHARWALWVEQRRRDLKAEGNSRPKGRAIEDVARALSKSGKTISPKTIENAIADYSEWASIQIDAQEGKPPKTSRH